MDIISFGSFTLGETGNWIANIISWLVNGTSVAVGIVLFTLILKAITLPFDVMSRVSMRKNSLKMEEMRPELERLQKQYADDKMLYNQKMQALYKKNGYSMWGACLPTILTLVIFIVAINGFTTYSQYKNREYFYEMTNAYNNVVYAGFEIDGEYLSRDAEGKLKVDDAKVLSLLSEDEGFDAEVEKEVNNVTLVIKRTENTGNTIDLSLHTANGYVNYIRTYLKSGDSVQFSGNPRYTLIAEKLENSADNPNPLASEENNYLKTEKGKTYSEYVDGGTFNANDFIKDIRRFMSATQYRKTQASFLWVKSIWATDSPMAHPVAEKAQTINQRGSCECNGEAITYLTEENYAELTYKLGEEKSAPNGYFILVILTALSSLLMQLVTSKSQKAQMELQTVDGQGAQTQKMMTWLMPIMMAVFAFVYTAAFSIYIILSSLISVATTLITNYFVGKKFDKIKTAKASAPVRGRIYVKKEEPKKNEKKKEEPKKVDFLNSERENRRIRKGK